MDLQFKRTTFRIYGSVYIKKGGKKQLISKTEPLRLVDRSLRVLVFEFVIALKLVDDDQSSVIYDNFKPELDRLAAGTISLPINIPGTANHSGLQVHYRRQSHPVANLLPQAAAEK
ncbi:hypothetical protein OIU74_018505 [Salix koriyanagi]|uniref:Uncharacterized protein n=1 Tax=Salix koriyanagi TaxID=2511006 RepID=A0A9Q1AI98_9ROSI|nr:hypothetical protein OIU74_018505 [Salix koriyanagi]